MLPAGNNISSLSVNCELCGEIHYSSLSALMILAHVAEFSTI